MHCIHTPPPPQPHTPQPPHQFSEQLFTVKQREELLAAYVEKTGRAGEYLVCSHGFLWDFSGISDADFSATCERLGIETPA